MDSRFISFMVCIFILAGCLNKNKTTVNTTVENNSFISINYKAEDSLLDEIRKKYLKHEISYINNPVDWGLGTINPKNFSFTLLLDTINNQKVYIDAIEAQEFIIPLVHKPDYAIFYIPVHNIYTDYYEIYLNSENLGFVKKDEFDFYSWPDFLMNTLSIGAEEGFVDMDKLESKVLIDNHKNFKVLEVDGDWIFAKEILDEDDGLAENGYWIKWREKDKLLIVPHFLM